MSDRHKTFINKDIFSRLMKYKLNEKLKNRQETSLTKIVNELLDEILEKKRF